MVLIALRLVRLVILRRRAASLGSAAEAWRFGSTGAVCTAWGAARAIVVRRGLRRGRWWWRRRLDLRALLSLDDLRSLDALWLFRNAVRLLGRLATLWFGAFAGPPASRPCAPSSARAPTPGWSFRWLGLFGARFEGSGWFGRRDGFDIRIDPATAFAAFEVLAIRVVAGLASCLGWTLATSATRRASTFGHADVG